MKYTLEIEKMINETSSQDIRNIKRILFEKASLALSKFTPQKKNTTTSNPIQVVDLFSGAGGMSLGFHAVNKVTRSFRFLGGCDINPIAAKTYSLNFATPIVNRNVIDIAYDETTYTQYLSEIEFNDKLPTILIACAPCQGFSSHRKKKWAEEDERNNLIIAAARIVSKMQPDCMLMENVPEILSIKYWDYFLEMKYILEENGYIVKQSIYNAAGFGVPQERFRSIIIAMKKDFLLPSPFIKRENYTTVRDAIGKLPHVEAGETIPGDPLHKSANHKATTIEVIKQVQKDGGSRPSGIGPKCLDKTSGYADVYGRLRWDKPSITITQYARNPASGRFSHPEINRGLTAREAAILQSFPKGFAFEGRFDGIFCQIGEAVPPLMACGVAASILVELLADEPTAKEKEDSVASVAKPVSNSYSSVIAGIKSKGRKS